jgi:phosphate transport system substrate-binding protein
LHPISILYRARGLPLVEESALKYLVNANVRAAAKVAVICGTILVPFSAMAEDVTLKSADGTVNLSGELLEFTDGNYVVRTDLGDLRISSSRVRCEGAACPVIETTTADVKIVGSDTVGEGLMPLMMGGFATYMDAEADIQNTQVDGEIIAKFVGEQGFGDPIGSYLVTSTSSGDAFKGLLDGGAQIGMSSRRITPEEARGLRDAGAGNMIDPAQEHIIAVDSLVVIAHPENPLTSISLIDLAKIYSGEFTNWSQVGGPDLPITVISREEGSGTLAVFRSKVFGEDVPPAPATQVMASDNNEAAAMVNKDVGAIAFVGYAFQRGAKALELVTSCGIKTTPDAFSGKTEEYAIQRRLYLYNRADNQTELSTKLLDFTKSEVADQVIAQSGFIDFGVSVRPQGMDSARATALVETQVDNYEANVIREMLAEMIKSDRLSTTFRFKTGSSELDARANIDLERLTKYLEAAPEGTTVTFVGFSDDIGEFAPNRGLSIGRAEKVAAQLKAFSGDRLSKITMNAIGFGEIAPSACNDSESGREINRRVEVWISKS